MGPPPFERATALVEIDGFVVDAGDTRLVAVSMPQDRLDDMGKDAEALVQRRRQRSPEIVQRPVQRLALVGGSDARIEVGLAAGPVLKPSSGTMTEDVIPVA